VIDLATLDSLIGFCPCMLRENGVELDLLTNLFFNEPGVFQSQDGRLRFETLTLFLDLTERSQGIAPTEILDLNLVETFRSCAYAGVLPDGRDWPLPKHLENVRLGWKVYQTHELLSIAVQTIFWAALKQLESQGGVTPSRQHFGDWFVNEFAESALGFSAATSFSEVVSSTITRLPKIDEFAHPDHEINIAWELLSSPFDRPEENTALQGVASATRILLALVARDSEEADPYKGWLERPEHHLAYYPINLLSLRKARLELWSDLSMREWLFWLVTSWGLDVHLKVALRKLRFELKDTFRIRPADDGFRVVGAIRPSLSMPRLSQAIQILSDIGAIEVDGDKTTATLTAKGRDLWKAGLV
jgi:hypothetical protein